METRSNRIEFTIGIELGVVMSAGKLFDAAFIDEVVGILCPQLF